MLELDSNVRTISFFIHPTFPHHVNHYPLLIGKGTIVSSYMMWPPLIPVGEIGQIYLKSEFHMDKYNLSPRQNDKTDRGACLRVSSGGTIANGMKPSNRMLEFQ
jgi:hypothetical protein